jgi:4-hydroxy-tetrahydrodipicolinate synthase
MALGAKVVISVTSNVVPELMVQMTHAALDGDWEKARSLHFQMLPSVQRPSSWTSNPIPVKTAMRMLKRPSGVFRLPLCDMEPATAEVLRKTLADMKLL